MDANRNKVSRFNLIRRLQLVTGIGLNREERAESRDARQKIKDRLVLVFGCLFFLALLVSVILTLFFKHEASEFGKMVNTTLYEYEQYSDVALSAADLYRVYDEKSYQSIKNSIKFSKALKDKYFSSEHYGLMADSYAEPSVTVTGLQYNYPPESKGVYEYLLELEVLNRDTGEKESPILLLVVQGGEIQALTIF